MLAIMKTLKNTGGKAKYREVLPILSNEARKLIQGLEATNNIADDTNTETYEFERVTRIPSIITPFMKLGSLRPNATVNRQDRMIL